MLAAWILLDCARVFLFLVFSMVTITACVTLQFSDELSGETCYSVLHSWSGPLAGQSFTYDQISRRDKFSHAMHYKPHVHMEQQEAPWQHKLFNLLLEKKAGQKEGRDERPFSLFKFLSQPPKSCTIVTAGTKKISEAITWGKLTVY